MSTKGCLGFILFCLNLDSFAKIKKDMVSTHSLKPFLLITLDLKKTKKISNTLLLALFRRKRVQNFTKNIKLY